MTAARRTRVAGLGSRDARAMLIALLVTAAALILGQLLRTTVEQRTDLVSVGGASSLIPDGWLVTAGDGESSFVATDPANAGSQYAVSVMTARAGDVTAEAARFAETLERSRSGLTFTSDGPVRSADRDGYEFRYAYVMAQPATLVRGIALAILDGGQAIIATYEAPDARFAGDLDRFYRLAATAKVDGT